HGRRAPQSSGDGDRRGARRRMPRNPAGVLRTATGARKEIELLVRLELAGGAVLVKDAQFAEDQFGQRAVANVSRMNTLVIQPLEQVLLVGLGLFPEREMIDKGRFRSPCNVAGDLR